MTPLSSLLAEVRALAEKATLWPWRLKDDVYRRYPMSELSQDIYPTLVEPDEYGPREASSYEHRIASGVKVEDAAFIVALVNLLPRLLALADGEMGVEEAIRAVLAGGGVMGGDVVGMVRLVVRERARFSREAAALRVAVVSMEAAANLHDLAARVHDGSATSDDAVIVASVATEARDAMATLEEARIVLPDAAPLLTAQDRAKAVVDAFWPPHTQAGRPDAVRELTALIAAALAEAHDETRGQLAATERASETSNRWFHAYQDEFTTSTRLRVELAQARGAGEARPLCDTDEREAMHEELAKEVLAMRAVVSAACAVVDADTYKHPMLSRADAVKAGVDGLLDAVATWRSLQPPAAPRDEREGT